MQTIQSSYLIQGGWEQCNKFPQTILLLPAKRFPVLFTKTGGFLQQAEARWRGMAPPTYLEVPLDQSTGLSYRRLSPITESSFRGNISARWRSATGCGEGLHGEDGQPQGGQGECASGQAINIHKSLPHHDSQGRKQSDEAYASCDCWDLDSYIDYAMV